MEWISLKKESPPQGEWVLGLTDGGGIFSVRRIAFKGAEDYFRLDWMLPYYVRDDAIFTHWMPIPEMPEIPKD